jgi:hypothetical protein
MQKSHCNCISDTVRTGSRPEKRPGSRLDTAQTAARPGMAWIEWPVDFSVFSFR